MVRIGFSRWFIETGKVPLNCGRAKYYVLLRPQAEKFRIFTSEWRGVFHSMVEKEVCMSPVLIESIFDNYGMTSSREVQLMKKLADEAASDAVYKCYASGILSHRKNYQGVDSNTVQQIAIFVVKTVIMKSVSTGIIDEDESEEICDLVPHMKELYEQQERKSEELVFQMKTAVKTSFDLLFEFISAKDRIEISEKGYVTVVNSFGEFRVPVASHGFVEQYVEGKHVQNYCLVFSNWSIPLGDEVLMKLALLKTDPERFMKTSNKQAIR